MKLSASILKDIDPKAVDVPGDRLLQLPEKVLQFGTGILLRGLPDYFIDKANRQQLFNGRIVMVKSTDRGTSDAFDNQDGLFTLCVRGVKQGVPFKENVILSPVSRVLSAARDWKQVLECARHPQMRIIISNTTEVGISLVEESVELEPPQSYPGKLLAFLLERFRFLGNNEEGGMLIIPTELIPENGKLLREIIFQLARYNHLPQDFMNWLQERIHFCNSLVDRIVTGMPEAGVRKEIEDQLGYEDDLLTVCEVYRLWAIEGDEEIKKLLGFAGADPGLIIEQDIELYRELKLRVLNGTHTLTSGVAFLSGVETVEAATRDPDLGKFMEDLMVREIGPSIPYPVDAEVLERYCGEVMDRFRNPHIRHRWINITLNYSSKIKMRCIPLLLQYYSKNGIFPELFTLGFAAYLFFMKAVRKEHNKYYGEFMGQQYLIDDEMAGLYYRLWQKAPAALWVQEVLSNESLWGTNLSLLHGFEKAVVERLDGLTSGGMRKTLQQIQSKRIIQ